MTQPEQTQRSWARYPELERALLEDFDDDTTWAVYGDWLAQQGDPLGERVALELRARSSASEFLGDIREQIAAFDDRYRAELLGRELVAFTTREAGRRVVELECARGFVTGARICFGGAGAQGERGRHVLDALQALLDSSAARFVRRLRVPGSDRVAMAVLSSGLLSQLQHLDLSKGVMTDEGAGALLDSRKELARNERLDLRENLISREMQARFVSAIPHALASNQRHYDEQTRLESLLAGKRFLWLDAYPENNRLEREIITSIDERWLIEHPQPVTIEPFETAARAVEAIVDAERRGRPFDLVLTHWGMNETSMHRGRRLANGPLLLTLMRDRDLRAPVILYSSATDALAREQLVLSLGARAYCVGQGDLFREILDVFSD